MRNNMFSPFYLQSVGQHLKAANWLQLSAANMTLTGAGKTLDFESFNLLESLFGDDIFYASRPSGKYLT